MPDWDEDGERLTENLVRALRHARDRAEERAAPAASLAKEWHALSMEGLRVPDDRYVGRFRGEPGLEHIGVRVGDRYGVPPRDVAGQLEAFISKLGAALDTLDSHVPAGAVPGSEDQLNAILEVCGWAHAEWIRIHPFANGNGRTARLWVNYVAMRYGLPPFLRLRPRPGAEYGEAGTRAMDGEWQQTVDVIRRLYLDAVRSSRTLR